MCGVERARANLLIETRRENLGTSVVAMRWQDSTHKVLQQRDGWLIGLDHRELVLEQSLYDIQDTI